MSAGTGSIFLMRRIQAQVQVNTEKYRAPSTGTRPITCFPNSKQLRPELLQGNPNPTLCALEFDKITDNFFVYCYQQWPWQPLPSQQCPTGIESFCWQLGGLGASWPSHINFPNPPQSSLERRSEELLFCCVVMTLLFGHM